MQRYLLKAQFAVQELQSQLNPARIKAEEAEEEREPWHIAATPGVCQITQVTPPRLLCFAQACPM